MACSDHHPNIPEQVRAQDEYLGGGGLICASAAVIALLMCSRTRPAARVAADPLEPT